MKININIDPRIFNDVYYKYAMNNDKRYQIYYGGSSSGKSFAVLGQRTILDVLGGKRNYLIVRNTQRSIRKSSFNEVTKAIKAFKVQDYFHVNKTDLTITCTLNDCQILFLGLDDPENIKSITPIKGVITDIILEEATQVTYTAYKQLDKRLRGISPVPKRMTFIFNPVLKDHWLYAEFFQSWNDGDKYREWRDRSLSILKTTYKDNKYLSEEDIRALEEETDKYYYEVYTLGNWGILGALIFKNWKTADLTDLIPTFDNIYNGVDWGYSTDPFAFIRCHYDKMRRRLYIFDELYLYEASNELSGYQVKQKVGREIVTCDSAEPKSIADFKTLGVNAIPAKKGKGSIEHGIKFLKSLEIIIHEDCMNTKLEFSKYKWKEDKNGNVLPVPVDKDNHLIDALRYALEGVNKDKWGW